jgi:hypothetical protein
LCFKGVTWRSQNKKWEANIRINKKQLYLGKFTDIKDAVRAYNEAAKKYHGKYACLNSL